MTINYLRTLRALPDDELDTIADALEGAPLELAPFVNATLRLMRVNQLRSLRAMIWAMGAGSRRADYEPPTEPGAERNAWLYLHNNACHLANFVEDCRERSAVLTHALGVAAENPAIFHNAACLACKLGDAELALQIIRGAVAAELDAAELEAIRTDDDLALISGSDRFNEAFAGRGSFERPAWAGGLTTIEYIQLREAIRTSLPSQPLDGFEAGVIELPGELRFDLAGLASECAGQSAARILELVTLALHMALRHDRSRGE